MENKINVAELLKDSPSGTELNCTMYEDVYFDYIDELCNIYCYIKNEDFRTSIMFNRHGRPNSNVKSKCVIFPKGKTTWEGFQRPFKDGDVVCYLDSIAIFKEWGDETLFRTYVTTYLHGDSTIDIAIPLFGKSIRRETRLATEEEKQKLFDTIKANGYKWNAETKTLEKLIEPKFKVGDRIRGIISSSYYTIIDIENDQYFIKTDDAEQFPYHLPISYEINYELVPNKFDITTLKPFDKVLVRDNNEQKWTVDLFSFYDKDSVYTFACVGHYVNQCIPYEDNEHLLGTTNDCDEYYKTWE